MSEEVAMAAADAPTIAQQAEQIARLTAQRDAAEKLVSDMRETFVRMRDERNRLRRADVWAGLWRGYAKQQRAGWRHAFEAQQRSVARWRESRARVVTQRDALQVEAAQLTADNAALLGAARRAGLVYMTHQEAMADIELMKADHPGARLLALQASQAEQLSAATGQIHKLLTTLDHILAAWDAGGGNDDVVARLAPIIARLRTGAPADDDGHGKPYLNEM